MKQKKQKIIIGAVLILVVAIVGIYFLLKYQTHSYMRVLNTYEVGGTDNAEYKECLDGVLRYSRDGVALLTKTGEEAWNHPCQMNNPIVEVHGDSVAVGDKGGTSILVFEKKGLKGEMQTTKPIEKLTVSSQGIVGAILKDDEAPKVVCYDAMGRILTENNVSPRNTGYPIDIALSEKGNVLLVSYLCASGSEMVSKITYYYLGSGSEDVSAHQVLQQELHGAMAPITTFIDKKTSLVVTDGGFYLFEGLKEPKQKKEILLDAEIQGVAYDTEMIAVLTKKASADGYQLHTYNFKGEQIAVADVEREYSNMKVVRGRVVLYDAGLCSIFMKNGVCKYNGKMETNILEIFPLSGFNKYMVINASGFQEVRLAK